MEKRTFILDTDWWTDCDDIVAVRLLCNLHKAEKINFKGICINTRMEHSVSSLSAFLVNEDLDLPIGISKAPITPDMDEPLKYQYFMKDFPHKLQNDDCLDGVSFYRKMLAESETQIEIIEIGFQNILADLLDSQPDQYSPLTGMELVKQKVKKLWAMAGKWDENPGREYNFYCCTESKKAGAYMCDNWPTPIAFLGFEVGWEVISGSKLEPSDFLKKCMVVHGSPNGRHSWDPMTALYAYIGDAEKAGYKEVFGKATVNPTDGSNTFVEDQNGTHSYVIPLFDKAYYANQIDDLL